MNKNDPPSESNLFHSAHVHLLAESYCALTKRELLALPNPKDVLARELFEAEFVLVSHGTESDPIFNYANRCALELFEMTWQEFVQLPSRLSAEPLNRQARAELMSTVSKQGYIDNYGGVRISSSGRRFNIAAATVWNVSDGHGNLKGQAATFDKWEFL